VDIANEKILENPINQFMSWHADAAEAGVHEPDAAVVSSVDDDGYPSSRFILVRKIDDEGFLFFTNYNSDKATSFSRTPKVSLTFGWFLLHRQVRILGEIEKATIEESDDYFKSRPRGHQLGAWASPQSQIIDNRDVLVSKYEEISRQFKNKEVPRPENWGGYRVRPSLIEFWQGQPDRLHDRFRFRKVENKWKAHRLAP
tara:strand:- start:484 stop:1083 length:600 start_codon:yes stop_codon:yes gene_type:complete